MHHTKYQELEKYCVNFNAKFIISFRKNADDNLFCIHAYETVHDFKRPHLKTVLDIVTAT